MGGGESVKKSENGGNFERPPPKKMVPITLETSDKPREYYQIKQVFTTTSERTEGGGWRGGGGVTYTN